MPSTTIYDTENQFNWQAKTTFTDDYGQVVSSDILYDSGLITARYYSEGVLDRTELVDDQVDGGLFNWTSKTNY